MSTALAGVFFTTQPPGKPLIGLRKRQKEVLILVLASCLRVTPQVFKTSFFVFFLFGNMTVGRFDLEAEIMIMFL